MKQGKSPDATGLLHDLESIHTLLNEDQPSAPALEIPLLEDIITSTDDRPQELTPASSAVSRANTTNPFLPHESLAKLADERIQLERLMQQGMQHTLGSVHKGAREVRMEARLQAEAQLVMQDVMDEILPVIEAELRKRLQGKLQQLIEEQLAQ